MRLTVSSGTTPDCEMGEGGCLLQLIRVPRLSSGDLHDELGQRITTAHDRTNERRGSPPTVGIRPTPPAQTR